MTVAKNFRHMTAAEDFLAEFGTDAASVMTALDAAEIPSTQDWHNGRTHWKFADGSQVVVDGPIVVVDNILVDGFHHI